MEIDLPSTDSMAPKTQVSQELARESLMAISQATPGKYLASPRAPVNSSDVTVACAKPRTNLQINLLPADSVAPKTEVSQELARESLMAISQATPGKFLTSPSAPVNSSEVSVATANDSGEAEKYRSKLISISYTQSPDVQPPPYSP